MPDCRRQLEQQLECRGVDRQLQQFSDEQQQQHRRPCGLGTTSISKLLTGAKGDVFLL